MFANSVFAKQCGKRWEHYERKRKKANKKIRKSRSTLYGLVSLTDKENHKRCLSLP